MAKSPRTTGGGKVQGDKGVTVPDWSAMLAEDVAAGRMANNVADDGASTIREIMAATGLSKSQARAWAIARVERGELERTTKYQQDTTSSRMQPAPAFRPIQKEGKP